MTHTTTDGPCQTHIGRSTTGLKMRLSQIPFTRPSTREIMTSTPTLTMQANTKIKETTVKLTCTSIQYAWQDHVRTSPQGHARCRLFEYAATTALSTRRSTPQHTASNRVSRIGGVRAGAVPWFEPPRHRRHPWSRLAWARPRSCATDRSVRRRCRSGRDRRSIDRLDVVDWHSLLARWRHWWWSACLNAAGNC